MGERHSDLSYEKANSAYMVFYERVPPPPEIIPEAAGDSKKSPELSEDLAKWIWEDNVNFARDLMLFDHQYFM